jgi:hypothetical protein
LHDTLRLGFAQVDDTRGHPLEVLFWFASSLDTLAAAILTFFTIPVTRSPRVGSHNPAHGILRHLFLLRVQLLRVPVYGARL